MLHRRELRALNLPSDVHDGESHIRLSRCLARPASIIIGAKPWRKSGRPNRGLGTKASSLGKRTRSRQIKRSEFDKSSRAEVARPRRKPPVRCALSKVSANVLGKWIAVSGKKRADYIFPGRGAGRPRPMTVR